MRKLSVFNSVTLDGYFTGRNGDLSWAKSRDDEEWNSFVAENAKGESTLVFGRVTYDMMKSYWPTPAALETAPVVAESMNKAPKLVFSRTLDRATWSNTKLVTGDPSAEMRRMKKEPGEDMVILGSGSIVALLARDGVIDEYQIVVTPVVLGEGRSMFEGLERRMTLKLTQSRTFGNGNAFLRYEPAA